MKIFIIKKFEARKETIKLIDETIGDYKYWKLKKIGVKLNFFGFIGMFLSFVLYIVNWISNYIWFENLNSIFFILLTLTIIIFVISLISIIISTLWCKKTKKELNKIWDKK